MALPARGLGSPVDDPPRASGRGRNHRGRRRQQRAMAPELRNHELPAAGRLSHRARQSIPGWGKPCMERLSEHRCGTSRSRSTSSTSSAGQMRSARWSRTLYPSGRRPIWLQLGIRNDAACARAEAAGIKVVANRCISVEHAASSADRRRCPSGWLGMTGALLCVAAIGAAPALAKPRPDRAQRGKLSSRCRPRDRPILRSRPNQRTRRKRGPGENNGPGETAETADPAASAKRIRSHTRQRRDSVSAAATG
jgi:hypothetical protein